MNMKIIRFCSLLILFCLCFSLSCFAAQEVTLTSEGMTLQIPDDFTVIQGENVENMASALRPYQTTVTETAVKLEQENYLFLGISSSMQCTLFLSRQEDRVSRSVGDLITYPDQDTARGLLLGRNLPDTMQVRELERNGALFYRVDFGVTDGIGRIAYMTVMNGKCYTLCVVDNSGSLSDNTNALLDTVFEQWEYTVDAETSRIGAFREKLTTVFFWICLPLALIAAAYIIRLLIRDFTQKHLEEDRQKNLPKKPRR